MSPVHPAEEELVMFYYREGDTDRAALQAHLDICTSCRAAYLRLEKVLSACDDLPVPEPHLAFESAMWHRLEPQLRPRSSGWRALFTKRWIAATAFPILLIGAFVAGRYTQPPRTTLSGTITSDGRDRVLRAALGDHLERSQMMLTELTNSSDSSAAGLALERERARDLISENRLYRQTTADSGDPAVAQLLDDLERVLLDISHGADSRDVRERIDAESLIFKLRVLGSTLNPSTVPAQRPAPKEKSL
jgi:hypothetical protein